MSKVVFSQYNGNMFKEETRQKKTTDTKKRRQAVRFFLVYSVVFFSWRFPFLSYPYCL